MADEIPAELIAWLREQAAAIAKSAQQTRGSAPPDPAAYLLRELERFAAIETSARRAVHALSAYAIRERITTASAVARTTGVTVSAAISRSGSPTASDALREALGQA